MTEKIKGFETKGKMSDQLEVNDRGCYCGLWEKNPSYFQKKGIPEGFCGLCMKCGRPGHTRHHPGAVPFTGSWCDYHYKITAWTHPATIPGYLIILLTAIGLVAFLIWKF